MKTSEASEDTTSKQKPEIESPNPRVMLPMRSEVNVLPGESVRITSQPQNMAFQPERLVIGDPTSDWLINDIKIDGKSQLIQAGDIRGEIFSAGSTDSTAVRFGEVGMGVDLEITATFVGDDAAGAPFVAAVLGTPA